MLQQDDALMREIMLAVGISRASIFLLERLRDSLSESPLGPEYATTEALRLSFARHLFCTGRLSEYMPGTGQAECYTFVQIVETFSTELADGE